MWHHPTGTLNMSCYTLYSFIVIADVFVVVYSITNTKTFTTAQEWVEKIKNRKAEDTPIVLCGNKSDDEAHRYEFVLAVLIYMQSSEQGARWKFCQGKQLVGLLWSVIQK